MRATTESGGGYEKKMLDVQLHSPKYRRGNLHDDGGYVVVDVKIRLR